MLRVGVHGLELEEVLVASHSGLLVLLEELLGALGELAREAAVASLVHEELLVATRRLLGVERELLALGSGRVEAVEVPVTALDGALHLELAVLHAALDGVHLAGAVADDQGRAVVGLGLLDGLQGLRRVGTHGNLGDVDVAVGHGDLGEGLLLGHLAGGSKLRDLAEVRGLGGLATRVGVDLGVEDEDVNVAVRGEDVVQAAEADIVSPAVAAEDPEGLLGQVGLVGEDGLGGVGAVGLEGLDVGGGSSLGGGGVAGVGVEPSLGSGLEGLAHAVGLEQRLGVGDELVVDGLVADLKTEAVLGVVLEQGVVPRGTVALGVDRVGRGRGRVAPDGGAAGGVGDEHAVAGDLGHEASVAGLGAAGAGAGELEERLLELRALGVGGDGLGLLGDLGDAVVEDLLLGKLLLLRDHGEGVLRAGGDADGAAHAVERADGEGELLALHLRAHGVEGAQVLGSRGDLGVVQDERTDGGVRADEGAGVALDALGLVPLRDHDRDATLLVSGGAELPLAVDDVLERGDRQGIAVHAVNGLEEVLDLFDDGGAALEGELGRGVLGGRPVGGHLKLAERGGAGVDGLVVGVDDSLALLHVGLGGRVLHVLQGLLGGQDLGQGKEGGLQNGVRALAHADLGGQVDGVDEVDGDVVLGDVALGNGRHVLSELLVRPLAVDQEGAARLDVADHLEALDDVARVVAGDEVGLGHIVRRADRGIAEAQVRDGDAAGLLGVVLEVGLDVLVGVVADDLDGVLVRTDGAVAAEAPELALDGAGGSGVRGLLGLRQAEVGDVVDDADGELALGLVLLELLEDGEGGRRGRVLRAEAVTAADDLDVGLAGLIEGGDDVLVKGLADGAGLLGAVHDGDLLDGLGDHVDEALDGERAEQADLDEADLLAVGVQVVDDLLEDVAEGAHADDDTVGVGGAVVVEQAVIGAELLVDLAHILLDDGGQLVIGLVAGLAVLEEDVAVLVGAASVRVLRVQGVVTERLDGIHVAHVLEVLVVPNGDLLDLVRGAEAVEEVEERDLALDGGEVGHRREVHDLLDVALGEHGEAGLAASHDVGVITEDVQSVGSDGTGRDVEDARQALARDLVHVRDHQEQALRSRVGGGQSAGSERAVDGTGGTGLGLHLDHVDGRAEDVFAALGCPLIDVVCHRAGRGDRVDTRNLGERVRYVRGRLIAVHGLELTSHILSFKLPGNPHGPRDAYRLRLR